MSDDRQQENVTGEAGEAGGGTAPIVSDPRQSGGTTARMAQGPAGHSVGQRDQPASSAADQAAAEEDIDDIQGEIIALDFEIAKSIRYHAKRRSFFDTANNLTRALSAVFAAGAVVSVVGGWPHAVTSISVLLAILSSADLVVDFSRKARIHDELCKEFGELAARFVEHEKHDKASARKFTADKLRIEIKEPTAMDVLSVICANEELEGRGYDYLYRVRWWQKLFSEFFSLPPYTYEQIPMPASKRGIRA